MEKRKKKSYAYDNLPNNLLWLISVSVAFLLFVLFVTNFGWIIGGPIGFVAAVIATYLFACGIERR